MAYDDARLIRQERVKALLLSGMSKKEIAKELGCTQDTVTNDVHAISQDAILTQAKDATSVAFAQYQQDVQWALEQAKGMQDALTCDGNDLGEGRIDAIGFVTKTRKESLELAQKLGLLEQVAEKKEVDLNVKGEILDPETIKRFGDYMATHAAEVDDGK
jgi:transposase